MVDFSKVSDAGAKHFGKSAAYTSPEGAVTVCRAIVQRPVVDDVGFGTPGYQMSPERQAIALLADVRKSEVAEPKQGGMLSTEGRTYPIRSVLLDTERQMWRLSLGRPE